MTSTLSDQDRSGAPEPGDGRSGAADMRRRGLVLLLGAVVIALAVQPIGPLDYYWNPLLVGLAFLAAAAATGAKSPLWGAGLVVSFWGLSKVFQNNVDFGWAGALTTVALGLGGLAAAFLVSRGFAGGAASVAWPVVFIGVGQYVHGTFPGAEITIYTAGITAVYGVVELVNSTRQDDTSTRSTSNEGALAHG